MSLAINARKNLGDFSLDIQLNTSSRRIGIIGSSGSGKSMTLRLISGLTTPDEGEIKVNETYFFNSRKSIDLPARNRKTGFLFQNYALFPNMTLEENILFPLDKKKKDTKDKVDALVEMLGLEQFMHRKPSQLSGGQCQRGALARALATEPDILMLDEPFSALDSHLRRRTMDRFVEYLKIYPGIILFVTHNMEEAYRFCDEIVVISKGRVNSHGKTESMFSNPPTRTAAKLAGYRNISPTAKAELGKTQLLRYGIDVKCTSEPKPFGILPGRSLSLGKFEEPDTYAAVIREVKESPFHVVLALEFKKGCHHVNWEIKRNIWNQIQELGVEGPLPIKIDMDTVLFVE